MAELLDTVREEQPEERQDLPLGEPRSGQRLDEDASEKAGRLPKARSA